LASHGSFRFRLAKVPVASHGKIFSIIKIFLKQLWIDNKEVITAKKEGGQKNGCESS